MGPVREEDQPGDKMVEGGQHEEIGKAHPPGQILGDPHAPDDQHRAQETSRPDTVTPYERGPAADASDPQGPHAQPAEDRPLESRSVPIGMRWDYRYDDARRLMEVKLAGTGERTTWSWNGLRPSSRTDPSGTTTSWTYLRDDVLSETQPSGNVVNFTRNAIGVDRQQPLRTPILQIQDSVGLVEERTYDGAGRLLSIQNGEGDTNSFTYDSQEMLATRTRPNGVVVSFADYGDIDQPATISFDNIEIHRVFDAVGNRVEGPDETSPELGGVMTRTFDKDRNLVVLELGDQSTWLPLATETITAEYRSDHRRTAIRRPGGGDHEFAYDAFGRLTELRERVDGAWHATTFEYNDAGRRTATEQANGTRVEMAFGANDRAQTMTTMRDGVTEGTATFHYDANGRLTQVDDSIRGSSVRYFYDAAGRISLIVYPDGEILVPRYDLRSRRTFETYASSNLDILRTLAYEFDLADREVRIVDDGTPILSRVYERGRIASVSYGNGLERTFTYDADNGILRGSNTVNASGQTVETTTIDTAVVGLWGETTATTATSGGVDATTVERYQLSVLDGTLALSSAGKRVWGWGASAAAGESDVSYSYDGLSNITIMFDPTGVFRAATYNAERNRLLSVPLSTGGSIDYTFDDSGFVTSRGGVPITWTGQGKLAFVGSDTSLEWDALGNLMSITRQGQTLRLLFGGRAVADGSGTPFAIDIGEVRIPLAGGDHLYRHMDFRENVKFTSNSQGQIVSHYRYSPYGLDAVFGADGDGVRFVGRVEIGELMILGLRIYDPIIGRFLSPDPILNLINQYGYTIGNPLWFQDPDGGIPIELELTVNGIVFGAAVVGLFAVTTPIQAVAAVIGLTASGVVFGMSVGTALGAGPGGASGGDAPGSGGGGSGGGAGGGGGSGGSGGSGGGGGGSAGTGGGGGSVSGGGGGFGGCSPSALTDLPSAHRWLFLLVPLQLLLGAALLYRRRSMT